MASQARFIGYLPIDPFEKRYRLGDLGALLVCLWSERVHRIRQEFPASHAQLTGSLHDYHGGFSRRRQHATYREHLDAKHQALFDDW